MVRTGEIRRPAAAVLGNLVLAGVYYGAAKVGLLEQVVVAGAVVTPLWPPTGIALSCLLLLGLWLWPGIALGTVLVIWTLTRPDLAGFGVVAGNTLAPVCACLMLRRVGFRTELDRLRDGVALVALGAFAAMVISATLGSGTQVLTGALPTGGFWRTWAAWWVGDAMGVLVVAPLLLACRTLRPLRDMPLYRWAEAAAVLAAAVVISLVSTRSSLSLLFLVFPVIVWAALRFQLVGAAPCVLVMSVFAISAATGRYGPFAGQSLLESMVNLQALNASAALTALLLSAIVTEQNTIRRKIEQVCRELAEVVDRLAPGESRRRWPPEH
ncbi:MASE1 domain-containing protein (plasmid) [Streptomyces sp. BHT-5-2]|uniref:MASE1 domain-containing protein n=1 Tax=unclassified Streptomyces TaxID=2593676 RepID=UPI001C8F1D8E|nr:MASE1 domain-containing protein [Streptomyces sp. BHT-5-2]QZL09206.1 MASE1 domain-containing protein [Streptomyces sp. BHT-5-2]